jgi:hypothetical protein
MPSIINATTTAGVSVQGDNSGELALQTNNGTNAITIDTAQNVTVASNLTVTGNTTASNGKITIGTTILGAGDSSAMKNRIINGAMVIDQRSAGASVTPTATGYFSCDRWNSQLGGVASKFSIQQNAGSVTPPVGFTNYLGTTSLSAYTVLAGDTINIRQLIEGFNVADLGFGTANAKTVTLSFWVRSSLTGTFGGSLRNSAVDRSYPYSYTISAANTWEQKSITIAGDTSGTWLTTNGIGLQISFGLGVGSTFSGTAGAWVAGNFTSSTGATNIVATNGATLYITGVQLEVGTQATGFEYRQYQQELALCQRYYYKTKAEGIASTFAVGFCQNTTTAVGMTTFPTTMRIAPTALEQSGTAGDYRVFITGGTTCSAVPAIASSTGTPFSISTSYTVASGLTANSGAYLQAVNSTAFLAWSAEL